MVVVAVLARAPLGVAFEALRPAHAIVVFAVIFLAVTTLAHRRFLLNFASLVAAAHYSLGSAIVLTVGAGAAALALDSGLQAHAVVFDAAARASAIYLGRRSSCQTLYASSLMRTNHHLAGGLWRWLYFWHRDGLTLLRKDRSGTICNKNLLLGAPHFDRLCRQLLFGLLLFLGLDWCNSISNQRFSQLFFGARTSAGFFLALGDRFLRSPLSLGRIRFLHFGDSQLGSALLQYGWFCLGQIALG